MEQSFDVKTEIKNILALCKKANAFGSPAQRAADVAFWAAVNTLDQKGKDGQRIANPGRFVRLPAKDGYAYYIITRVTKKTVKLEHIPYGVKYQSECVIDDEAELTLVEDTLKWYDEIKAQFNSLGTGKPLAPNP